MIEKKYRAKLKKIQIPACMCENAGWRVDAADELDA